MKRFGETTLIVVLATVVVSSSVAPLLPLVATMDHHPRYAYNYAVHDPLTKDNKAQWETRYGDVVKGSYSLQVPDGSVRIVDYFADDHTGFNAEVKRFGPNIHPTQLLTHVSLPLHLSTPVLHPIVAPLNYGFGAAPIAIGLPKAASFGKWSLPWDSFTGSYGGWAPLSLKGPYATIFSKKYINGKLHKWVTGPISLSGNKLVFKTKH